MGEVDDGVPPALVGRRQPVRRHAVRAAALQLRRAAPVRGLRRRSSGSASPSRPGSDAHGRPAQDRLALALASRRWRRCGRRRRRSAPAAPFLFINQERLLTGSKAGQALLAEEERERDALRAEARAIDSAFEAEEQRLTELRPTLRAGGVPRAGRRRSTRAWSRRGASRTTAPARWRRSLTSAAGRSTLAVAPILVMLMDRYRRQGDLRREQRAAGGPVAEHHRGGHRRDRRPRGGAGRTRRRRRGAAAAPTGAGRGRRRESEHGTGDRPGAARRPTSSTIKRMIPHRYPFLLIDRVVNIEVEPLRRRAEERHRQRAAFRGPFPGPPGDARRADHRGDGADLRRAGGRDARAASTATCWSIS